MKNRPIGVTVRIVVVGSVIEHTYSRSSRCPMIAQSLMSTLQPFLDLSGYFSISTN